MRGGRFSPQACARWPLGRGDKAERLVLLIPRSEYRPECGNCPQTLPHAYSVRFCSGRLPSSPLPPQGRESQTPPHPAGHPDPARRCPCLTVTQGMWARGRRGSALRFSLGQTRKVWVRIQNPVPMLGVGRLSPAPLRRWGSRSPPPQQCPGLRPLLREQLLFCVHSPDRETVLGAGARAASRAQPTTLSHSVSSLQLVLNAQQKKTAAEREGEREGAGCLASTGRGRGAV